MTDELIKRLRGDWLWYDVSLEAIDAMEEAADRIEVLTAERDRLRDYIDRYSYADIAAEVVRAEKAEAERDSAYASGYSDAETEISKSALGQGNAFLHSQYANAKLRIEALTALLTEAAADLTACVNAEYPPDTCAQYPHIAKRHHRDMELVRRIQAALTGKGPSHE